MCHLRGPEMVLIVAGSVLQSSEGESTGGQGRGGSASGRRQGMVCLLSPAPVSLLACVCCSACLTAVVFLLDRRGVGWMRSRLVACTYNLASSLAAYLAACSLAREPLLTWLARDAHVPFLSTLN